jgi:hypothetical protein
VHRGVYALTHGPGLVRLHDAGAELPRVNVRIAGEEADLVFEEERRIVEITALSATASPARTRARSASGAGPATRSTA